MRREMSLLTVGKQFIASDSGLVANANQLKSTTDGKFVSTFATFWMQKMAF